VYPTTLALLPLLVLVLLHGVALNSLRFGSAQRQYYRL